ncbi:zinc-binding dehydrogenase [Chloroflexota bacterium]
MKAFEITGPKGCRIVDVDIPTPDDDDVVMKMLAVGICAADAHAYQDGGFFGKVTEQPARLGHEGVGRITSVGSAVKDFKVGDYVTFHCAMSPKTRIGIGGDQGAFQEYLLVRDADKSLFSLGENVPIHIGAECEPLSVSIGGINAADPKPGEKAVIFGGGPIGLGAVVWLKLCGAAGVVVVEGIEARRQKALVCGADATIDPSDNVVERLIEILGPSPYPSQSPKPDAQIFYECCGVGAAVQQAMACAHNARIIVGGMHTKPVPVNFMDMMMGRFSMRPADVNPGCLIEAAAQLTRNPDIWAPVLHEETLPFTEIERALQIVLAQETTGKLVVTFDN